MCYSIKECKSCCFHFGGAYLQVVDCRVCGDPHSRLRFAFVEFADECKYSPCHNFCDTLSVLVSLKKNYTFPYLAKFNDSINIFPIFGPTYLAKSPQKVYASISKFIYFKGRF